MTERHNVPPAGRRPIGRQGGPNHIPAAPALDLAAMQRMKEAAMMEAQSRALKIEVLSRFNLQAFLNVNDTIPFLGVQRGDGKPVPGIILTGAEDRTMRVYLLEPDMIQTLIEFLTAAQEQESREVEVRFDVDAAEAVEFPVEILDEEGVVVDRVGDEAEAREYIASMPDNKLTYRLPVEEPAPE